MSDSERLLTRLSRAALAALEAEIRVTRQVYRNARVLGALIERLAGKELGLDEARAMLRDLAGEEVEK